MMQRVEAEKGRVKWAENAMRETHNAVPADAPLWERMSADEYAAVQLALGRKVVKSGDVWWRQVRPFFYRPLLPYRELRPGTLRYPLRSLVGGVRHAITCGVQANSFLNLLLFEEPRSYSLEGLTKNKRYQLRRAMKTFAIGRITNADEFIAKAHPVYLSFYERTKYSYKPERTHEHHFASWARTIFSFPKVLVLGAYRQEHLVSVSVSYLVEDAVYLATFFSSTDALSDYVSDLLLHAIRENAAANDEVKLIFASTAGMERGLDDYYLRRGATLARKPAWLKINPLVLMLLKTFKKNEYNKVGVAAPKSAE